MSRSNIHPLTGRQDYIRSDASWRKKIEYYEAKLGRVICGAHLKESGTPCLAKPKPGAHRCPKHEMNRKTNPQDRLKYHSRIVYGMTLNGFMHCSRCKDANCKARVNEGEDDTCPLEVGIYNDVMSLKDKYNLNDYLQEGMLERVAHVFIKQHRCDRMIANDGMIVEEIIGFDRETGKPIKNRKEHPLLKHSSNLNRELIAFADAIEFSPKAQSRKQANSDLVESGENVITQILQNALHKHGGLTDD